MTARLSSLSRNAQIALVVGGLALVTVVGWFAFVAPKRSTANDLKEQTAAVQAQIDQSKTSAFSRALPAVRSASVFSLAKAMPSRVAMPDVILELNQLATDAGISFDEITPQSPAADTAFDVEPINMQFTGNFYNLSDFLLRMRNLVRVENGKLLANGRMFAVSDLKFGEAQQKFPIVTATMTVNTFVPAAPQPVAPAVNATTTTGTTTTPAPAAPSAASTGGQS
jgi:Tfp pilus assembly protein PilO